MLKDKQRELILAAKGKYPWSKLSQQTTIGSHYLAAELKNETRLLSDEAYYKLCKIAEKNFDDFIIERHSDNWGRVKGGHKSDGNKVTISIPEKDERLAEFIGAILGDGNVSYYTKPGVYQVKIAGDYTADREYHTYLKEIVGKIFNIRACEVLISRRNERFLVFSSKNLVEYLLKNELHAGDKIKSQVTIPSWIWKEDKNLRACLRGLIDTDGSIFRMSQRDSNLLRISFTNYNQRLLNDAHNAFRMLGFSPTKIIQNKRFFISKQADIKKYLNEIGFSNEKHRTRLAKFNTALSSRLAP